MLKTPGIILEDYQNANNGLFPASIKSKNKVMTNFFWIRDNYYIYLAVNKDSKQKIITAFKNIIDYNKELKKFDYKPTEDWMHIHPRYDKELKEIPEEWGWVQNDTVGDMLEILSNSKDNERANLLVNYLNTIEYWNCPDFGFWEEGPKELRSSSLASCIRGLQAYKENFKTENKKIDELINKGYNSLYMLFPNETKTREHDLALLNLLWPKQIIPDYLKDKIIPRVQSLEGHWGIKRYFGDTWDGNDNSLGLGKEMQWNFFPWMYFATEDEKYFLRAKEIKNKFQKMYEGFINGEPNQTHLLWSEAMYKLAEDKFNSK